MTNFERTSTKPGLEHRGLADGGVGVAKEPSQSAFPAPVICITTPCNLQPLVSRNSKAPECCLSACSKTFACLHRHIKSTGIDDDLAASRHPLLGMGALNAVERGWAAKPPAFAVVTLPCQMDTKKCFHPQLQSHLTRANRTSEGQTSQPDTNRKWKAKCREMRPERHPGTRPSRWVNPTKRRKGNSSVRLTALPHASREFAHHHCNTPLTQSKITSKNRQPHSVETNASLLSPRENADRRVGDAGFVLFCTRLVCGEETTFFSAVSMSRPATNTHSRAISHSVPFHRIRANTITVHYECPLDLRLIRTPNPPQGCLSF